MLESPIQGHSDDLVLFSIIASGTTGALGASSIIVYETFKVVGSESWVGGNLKDDLLFAESRNRAHPRKGEQD